VIKACQLIKSVIQRRKTKLSEINHTNNIEVCFSPKLVDDVIVQENLVVVVVDILRASTSMVSAVNQGAVLIPVATIAEAKKLKKDGFLVAAERDGKILDFADFGNSAFEFINNEVRGKDIVFSTTNGTVTLASGAKLGQVVLGAFSNISALADWLTLQKKNILILCSGWKNTFCLEDTIFAGALAEKLMARQNFNINCDSAYAAIDLWNTALPDVLSYIEKALHRERLRQLGADDVLEFSFKADTAPVVPVLTNEGRIVNCKGNE
jgi:2-phosphosulfolactate phosphatase